MEIKMNKLKVAIVQSDAKAYDIGFNTEKAMRLMQQAKKKQADIVLFPECFLQSYNFPKILETLPPLEEIKDEPQFKKWVASAIAEDDSHLLQIRNYARELELGVVMTAFSKGRQYPQNTAWMIDRNGEIILKYSKVHTCDFWCERYLECGEHFPVCEFDGVKIGIMICYDREYPESARELMLQGVEIILHPNCCGAMKPRLRELSVRAMENMVGIAMANPPGEEMGCSCAYHPMVWNDCGEISDNEIAVADELFDGIFMVEFDMAAIREYREREDLGKYRKPKAYVFTASE